MPYLSFAGVFAVGLIEDAGSSTGLRFARGGLGDAELATSITFSLQITPLTATTNDFAPNQVFSGTTTIGAGSLYADLPITLQDNANFDGRRTFQISFNSIPAGYSSNPYTFTIRDDELEGHWTNGNDTRVLPDFQTGYAIGLGGRDSIRISNPTDAVRHISGEFVVDFSGKGYDGYVFNYISDGTHSLEIAGIEEIIIDGSSGNDTIVGGAHTINQFDPAFSAKTHEIIWGYAGNDTLAALGSDITLIGGEGDDILLGNLLPNPEVGRSSLYLSAASYEDATSGVTVNLNITSAQNVGGGRGTDTLKDIDNLKGSAYDDTLIGRRQY